MKCMADILLGIRFFVHISDCLLPGCRTDGAFLYLKVKDVKKETYTWKIHGFGNETIRRYCHNCGHVTGFKDSGKIRRNANGKDIFVFAIYKCENDHTWNRFLGNFKSRSITDEAESPETPMDEKESLIAEIDLAESAAAGNDFVEILIEEAGSRVRLDKLLAGNLKGLSRSKIASMIERGKIRLDDRLVKPGTTVTEGAVITIMLPSEVLL